MYVVFNGNLYNFRGLERPKNLATIPIYESQSAMPIIGPCMSFVSSIELPDGYYRKRRDKFVIIPDEWLGKFPTKRTLRERKNKRRKK